MSTPEEKIVEIAAAIKRSRGPAVKHPVSVTYVAPNGDIVIVYADGRQSRLTLIPNDKAAV